MIRLFLADDHRLIRDGIRALLKTDETIQITGEAATGTELLEKLEIIPADVVILDIQMSGMDGFETIRILRHKHPDIKVMVLSMHENERYVQQMMESGAAGYLLKTTNIEEIRQAIRLVAEGMQYISSSLTLSLLLKPVQGVVPSAKSAGINNENFNISKREREVLHLISEGFTNAEISEKLFTSKRTIETHRQNLLEKTRSRNTAALVKFAMLNGIIS